MWNCPACTFENSSSSQKCEICGTIARRTEGMESSTPSGSLKGSQVRDDKIQRFPNNDNLQLMKEKSQGQDQIDSDAALAAALAQEEMHSEPTTNNFNDAPTIPGDYSHNQFMSQNPSKLLPGSRRPFEVAPVFVDDSEFSNCPSCGKPFSLTFRRHHCKCCGALVCADCSNQKQVLPVKAMIANGKDVMYSKEQRVCEMCFDHLSNDQKHCVRRYFYMITLFRAQQGSSEQIDEESSSFMKSLMNGFRRSDLPNVVKSDKVVTHQMLLLCLTGLKEVLGLIKATLENRIQHTTDNLDPGVTLSVYLNSLSLYNTHDFFDLLPAFKDDLESLVIVSEILGLLAENSALMSHRQDNVGASTLFSVQNFVQTVCQKQYTSLMKSIFEARKANVGSPDFGYKIQVMKIFRCFGSFYEIQEVFRESGLLRAAFDELIDFTPSNQGFILSTIFLNVSGNVSSLGSLLEIGALPKLLMISKAREIEVRTNVVKLLGLLNDSSIIGQERTNKTAELILHFDGVAELFNLLEQNFRDLRVSSTKVSFEVDQISSLIIILGNIAEFNPFIFQDQLGMRRLLSAIKEMISINSFEGQTLKYLLRTCKKLLTIPEARKDFILNQGIDVLFMLLRWQPSTFCEVVLDVLKAVLDDTENFKTFASDNDIQLSLALTSVSTPTHNPSIESAKINVLLSLFQLGDKHFGRLVEKGGLDKLTSQLEQLDSNDPNLGRLLHLLYDLLSKPNHDIHLRGLNYKSLAERLVLILGSRKVSEEQHVEKLILILTIVILKNDERDFPDPLDIDLRSLSSNTGSTTQLLDSLTNWLVPSLRSDSWAISLAAIKFVFAMIGGASHAECAKLTEVLLNDVKNLMIRAVSIVLKSPQSSVHSLASIYGLATFGIMIGLSSGTNAISSEGIIFISNALNSMCNICFGSGTQDPSPQITRLLGITLKYLAFSAANKLYTELVAGRNLQLFIDILMFYGEHPALVKKQDHEKLLDFCLHTLTAVFGQGIYTEECLHLGGFVALFSLLRNLLTGSSFLVNDLVQCIVLGLRKSRTAVEDIASNHSDEVSNVIISLRRTSGRLQELEMELVSIFVRASPSSLNPDDVEFLLADWADVGLTSTSEAFLSEIVTQLVASDANSVVSNKLVENFDISSVNAMLENQSLSIKLRGIQIAKQVLSVKLSSSGFRLSDFLSDDMLVLIRSVLVLVNDSQRDDPQAKDIFKALDSDSLALIRLAVRLIFNDFFDSINVLDLSQILFTEDGKLGVNREDNFGSYNANFSDIQLEILKLVSDSNVYPRWLNAKDDNNNRIELIKLLASLCLIELALNDVNIRANAFVIEYAFKSCSCIDDREGFSSLMVLLLSIDDLALQLALKKTPKYFEAFVESIKRLEGARQEALHLALNSILKMQRQLGKTDRTTIKIAEIAGFIADGIFFDKAAETRKDSLNLLCFGKILAGLVDGSSGDNVKVLVNLKPVISKLVKWFSIIPSAQYTSGMETIRNLTIESLGTIFSTVMISSLSLELISSFSDIRQVIVEECLKAYSLEEFETIGDKLLLVFAHAPYQFRSQIFELVFKKLAAGAIKGSSSETEIEVLSTLTSHIREPEDMELLRSSLEKFWAENKPTPSRIDLVLKLSANALVTGVISGSLEVVLLNWIQSSSKVIVLSNQNQCSLFATLLKLARTTEDLQMLVPDLFDFVMASLKRNLQSSILTADNAVELALVISLLDMILLKILKTNTKEGTLVQLPMFLQRAYVAISKFDGKKSSRAEIFILEQQLRLLGAEVPLVAASDNETKTPTFAKLRAQPGVEVKGSGIPATSQLLTILKGKPALPVKLESKFQDSTSVAQSEVKQPENLMNFGLHQTFATNNATPVITHGNIIRATDPFAPPSTRADNHPCPSCTFENHLAAKRCEMCNSPLL